MDVCGLGGGSVCGGGGGVSAVSCEVLAIGFPGDCARAVPPWFGLEASRDFFLGTQFSIPFTRTGDVVPLAFVDDLRGNHIGPDRRLLAFRVRPAQWANPGKIRG